jgi:hypothetical protein
MPNKHEAEAAIEAAKDPRSEVAGLKRAAEMIGPVETLVVFRPTRTEAGELGTETEAGVRPITRNARWEGWVLVYRFASPPVLEGAFPMSGTNGTEIQRTLEQGQSMPVGDLLRDAMKRLEGAATARLSVPGCPSAPGAP